jgi:hypothetical protein
VGTQVVVLTNPFFKEDMSALTVPMQSLIVGTLRMI